MAAAPRFATISHVPVIWDANDQLVSEDPAYLPADQLPQLFGVDGLFIDLTTGLSATYYDVRAALAVPGLQGFYVPGEDGAPPIIVAPPETPPTEPTNAPLLPPPPIIPPIGPVAPTEPPSPLGPTVPTEPAPSGGGGSTTIVNVAPPDFGPLIDALNSAIGLVTDAINGVANDVVGGLTPILQGIIDSINQVAAPIIDAINAGTAQIVAQVALSADDINRQAQQSADQISASMQAAAGQITADADANAAKITDAVNAQGDAITQAIGAESLAITESVAAIGTQISDTITAQLQITDTAILTIGQEITSGIESTLNALLPGLLDTLSANTATLAGLVSSLESSLTSTTDFWQTLFDTMAKNKAANLAGIKDYAGSITAGVSGEIATESAGGVAGGLAGRILQFPGVTAGGGALSGLAAAAAGLGGIGAAVVGLLLAYDILQELKSAGAKAPLALVDQLSQSLFLPAIPDIAQMIIAQRRNVPIEGSLETQAHKQGWPDWAINMFKSATLERLPPQQYAELWRRQFLDDGQFGLAIGQVGFDPQEITNLQNLSAFVPQPQDVIRFLLRDVYFPDIVAAFGADSNFSDAWAAGHTDFERAGVDQATALKFWEAHWELPSATEGFSLYHRISTDGAGDPVTLPDGTTQNRQIALSDITRLLRARGVEPFWRQPLINIAFRPLTRIDLRRAHALSILSESDVFAGYVNLGYTPENARHLTDLTLALSKAAQAKAADPLATATRTKLLTAYERMELTDAELTSYLTNGGYQPSEITAIVADAVLVRGTVVRATTIAGIKRLFDAGNWTDAQATDALGTLGLGNTETGSLISEWNLALTYHNLHVKHASHVDATKAETTKAYEEGLINVAQATTNYAALGLTANEITLLLSLADHRKALSTLREQTDAIKSNFLAGHIDEPTASQQLDALNLPAISRDALLSRWQNELSKLSQHLPLSTVGELRKSDLLTDDQARQLLASQGIATSIIDNLLALWGSQEAAAKIKAASAVTRAQAAAQRAADAAKARADRAARASKRELTAADIAKAVIDGIITVQEAYATLQARGYTPDDAFDYLTIHKVDMSTLLP